MAMKSINFPLGFAGGASTSVSAFFASAICFLHIPVLARESAVLDCRQAGLPRDA
jgi:hypothetical protein